MQDRWGGGEDVPAQRQGRPCWEAEEEEEVEIGMWSNSSPSSQEASAPGHWSYGKKIPPKLNKGVGKQDDNWVNSLGKQFNNMNFRETSEETLKCNKMDTPGGMDKRMDGDRPVLNMGEFNGMMGKGPGLRHHVPKESSADRGPYFDKNVSSLFGSGNPGAGQGRGTQQNTGLPLNSSQPTLRAQVPPPLLPSQVPPSVLKYPLNNSAISPLLGPQQVAVLNQLSHLNQLNQLNQISQLQRLLLQQQKLQNQRNMAAGVRQQQELQNRPMGSSHQMMPPPHSRHLDPSMKSQTPPQPPPSLHQSNLKSYLENYMPQNAPDLQKGQSSFSNFPLGLNSNMNVSSMDIGGVGFKEPQSRLNKWIAMDISGNSQLDQSSGKPGVLSSGMRLEDSLFGPQDLMGSGHAPVSPPGSVGTAGPSVPNHHTAPATSPGRPSFAPVNHGKDTRTSTLRTTRTSLQGV
ncbi:hypothetical protein ANANG_G00287980 [Anguilla anguilla]|uniref:TNRC6 PABC binding domain-containing protein n=1 Tax=Anguilla anguilla TaxID=7936 RepID=A0A9D3LPA1_ANGAN|nr:hypothetical protein ANANG_G00287980 [Anguilla anguilla]